MINGHAHTTALLPSENKGRRTEPSIWTELTFGRGAGSLLEPSRLRLLGGSDKGSAGCICFPEDEPPFFLTPEMRDAAAGFSVLCMEHASICG